MCLSFNMYDSVNNRNCFNVPDAVMISCDT